MKVIRFPGADQTDLRDQPGAAIDAALNGETAGPEADALRGLRAEVRALAEPPDADFEAELQARVAEWGARSATRRPSLNERLARLRRRIGTSPGRSLAIGGAGAALAAALAVVLLVGPLGSGSHIADQALPKGAELHSATKAGLAPATVEETGSTGTPASGAAKAGPVVQDSGEASLPAATAAPGRLQQLGASVALATSSGGVQEAADSVTRLGARDGGYVESSHVQVRRGGPSEATLTLSLPSAKLSSAIAALGQIASVRAVNQESQDITSSYDGARRRLADDEAVRRALLRALAGASTQGQIDSLREQLNSNRAAISRDREALHAVSQRAARSQLEVTITGGDAGQAHEGLTLGRGLRDAGHVLAGAAAVGLIALAVLVPLAILAIVLDALVRAWRRRRREAVLEP